VLFAGARSDKEDDYPSRKRPLEPQGGGGFSRPQYEWNRSRGPGNSYPLIHERLGSNPSWGLEGCRVE
jgi:hypothetical protein